MQRGLAKSGQEPFVGRDVELDELASQLGRTLSGSPSVALLVGEAGVGKSRLLRELAALAQRLGVQVVYGRAIDGATTPYLPFLNLFECCARDLLGELARPEDGALPRPELGSDRLRFFSAVIQRIFAAAQRQPLLVVVDDLHWADPASLDLLGQLLFAVVDEVRDERLPLMIVGAQRPLARDQRLSHLSEQLQREGVAQVLELAGLTLTETQSLLIGLGMEGMEQPLLAAVHEATHGNPLFVREIPAQLELRKRIATAQSGVGQASMHFELPRGLQNVLSQRLATLADEDIEVLRLAALLSDDFSLERIARVAGQSHEPMLRLLRRATDAELIAAEGAAFRFRHPLIRELLASTTHPTQRPSLHARIAGALEAEGASGLLSLEISGHLLAIPEHDPRAVLHHAKRGAEHAVSVYAWAKGAQMYAAAATAALACRDVPAQELGELEYQCALAHQHQFDFSASFSHYSGALRAFTEAADFMGQARTLRNLTRLRYSSNETRYGKPMDLSTHERMLARLGRREPAVRGVLLEAMALAYWTARRTEQAEALARQAFALGESTDDDRLRGDAHFTLGLILWQGGQLSEAYARFCACDALWADADDVWARTLPRQRMCALSIAMGNLDEAERGCDDARLLTERICNVAEEAFVAANRAIIALARGELQAVERHAVEAAQFGRRSRWGFGAMHSLLALSIARSLEGRHEDALYALAMLTKPGEFYEILGAGLRFVVELWRDYLVLHAQPENATQALRERIAKSCRLIDAAPIDANAASMYCLLLESASLLRDPSLVPVSYARIERLRHGGMILTDAGHLLPRVLGQSAVLIGDPDLAEHFFSEAVEVAERIGASLELGRSLLAQADFLAHKQEPDRIRAAQLALRASAVWSQLGLAEASHSALHLVLECGASAPALDSPLAHAVLSANETTLLRRIAQGRAYAQIARELLIDAARVTALVEVLYAKLELDGPGLATAYALAYGIAAPAAAVLYESTVVMVTDMVDFTGMVQRMGDLAARRVVHVHNRVIRRNLAAHGGKEVTHTGDGMIAAFRAADEAIACARSIQRELAPSSELPISIRIGLNRGRVLPEEDRLFGAALIAAVRICARAQGGQVLLSESVCHAIVDQALVPLTALGKVQLKGFDAPAEIYALAQ